MLCGVNFNGRNLASIQILNNELEIPRINKHTVLGEIEQVDSLLYKSQALISYTTVRIYYYNFIAIN